MNILIVEQNGDYFTSGDVVEHIEDGYTVKIVKFIAGPAEDQMWFYFKDCTEPNGFKESGEDNYVKDLKNFQHISIDSMSIAIQEQINNGTYFGD